MRELSPEDVRELWERRQLRADLIADRKMLGWSRRRMAFQLDYLNYYPAPRWVPKPLTKAFRYLTAGVWMWYREAKLCDAEVSFLQRYARVVGGKLQVEMVGPEPRRRPVNLRRQAYARRRFLNRRRRWRAI